MLLDDQRSEEIKQNTKTEFKRFNINLTLCMLGNFPFFCCHLLIFFKITFSKDSFMGSIRVSNGLDPDQDRCSVVPDLGPNRLQRLSADNKSRC